MRYATPLLLLIACGSRTQPAAAVREECPGVCVALARSCGSLDYRGDGCEAMCNREDWFSACTGDCHGCSCNQGCIDYAVTNHGMLSCGGYCAWLRGDFCPDVDDAACLAACRFGPDRFATCLGACDLNDCGCVQACVAAGPA